MQMGKKNYTKRGNFFFLSIITLLISQFLIFHEARNVFHQLNMNSQTQSLGSYSTIVLII